MTLFVVTFTACNNSKNEVSIASYSRDLQEIIESGTLNAAISLNSVDYFIYKGEPMGFQYEMLELFADQLGVELSITIVKNEQEAIDLLEKGKIDLIAMALTVNSSKRQQMAYSEPIMETRQVLVQRKPVNWSSMTPEALDKILIRDQVELAYKTIYVEQNSSYYTRLLSLSEEIGDTIHVIAVPYSSEELVKSVVFGDIDYTVADENVARVSAAYYPNIDVSTPVSFMQKIAWGFNKNNSEEFAAELNKWINSFRKTKSYANLYIKYYKNSKTSTMLNSEYYSFNTGKISKWDDLLKTASAEIGWDWRLLSSLVYQESRFNPDVVSWVGAFGLMQVMPITGDFFGVDITEATPEENVSTGVKYLEWLEYYFIDKIEDKNERLKFVLAAYNAGPGHILDAMRLAEQNGDNPYVWDDNVSKWLIKKSDPNYYSGNSAVKNGYSRGEESVNFVTEILKRYEHYKFIVPENTDRLTHVHVDMKNVTNVN